jgi:GNAT superfamily N-acetyltransferase
VAYVSEPLASRHDVSAFHSGRPQLDEWLREHALGAVARRTARTFVWHPGDDKVIGYYAIVAHLIVKDELPRSLAHGSPEQIPAVQEARLALDQSVQGQRLGGALLADALGRIVEATATVAARFVVVDAIDANAVRFYEHYGFRAIPGTQRLIQKVSDIVAALHERR